MEPRDSENQHLPRSRTRRLLSKVTKWPGKFIYRRFGRKRSQTIQPINHSHHHAQGHSVVRTRAEVHSAETHGNQQESLPRKPGQNDRLYTISADHVPYKPLRENIEGLVAPVKQGGPCIESNRTPQDFMDAVAKEIKTDGAFRRVHIRYDGDPEGKRARVQHIMHDTGAGISLTFEHKLNKLGISFRRGEFGPLTSVTGQKFQPIGVRDIRFSYFLRPDKEHWARLFVLEDPEHGKEPAWDMLFGRDTILNSNALMWNYDEIGIHSVGYVHPSSNKSAVVLYGDKDSEATESNMAQTESEIEQFEM